MIFRQLFDQETSTYSYIIADPITKEAIIIDPVLEQTKRDLSLIKELELRLKFILETHVHADHISSASLIRKETQAQIAVSKHTNAKGADLFLEDRQELLIGDHKLLALSTPGHTNGCMSYYIDNKILTGDALFIRGCGRTDFQEGSAETLYNSVHNKIYILPDSTLIYPGHDYNGMSVSSVKEEKAFNPRLNLNVEKKEFIEIMNQLDLSKPQKIDIAVPANLKIN